MGDKIKGGWAGQTIGCTFGGPVEFLFNGTIIQDYTPITWPDGAIKKYFDTFPGLYDDVYMDLTFVNVFERLGLDAPVDSIAMAFAHSKYPLWHANQSARYNILHGIMPPASGNWINNPHADDIDYQIEADYAGLMSPGMPNTASEFSDKIGHIISSGDGWYGGVFVGAMYSTAFVSSDVEFIVSEGLKTIPSKSSFYQCISDVIGWHKRYPNDWKQTWFECQKNGVRIMVVRMAFLPASILMRKSTVHTWLSGCSMGKVIFIKRWISLPDAVRMPIAIRQLQPVFWERCSVIVISPNIGRRICMKSRNSILHIQLSHSMMYIN